MLGWFKSTYRKLADRLAPKAPPEAVCLLALHKPDSPRVADVVFVHGLGGHPAKTWQTTGSMGEPCDWRQWLADDYPHLGVWAASYPTKLVSWNVESCPIPQLARNLMHALSNAGLGMRPLVFVNHSLGGLVAKEIMTQAAITTNKSQQGLWLRCRAVAFLGTPHSGSDVASIGVYLRRLVENAAGLELPKSTLDELVRNSGPLKELNLAFQQWVARRHNEPSWPSLAIVAYQESKPMHGHLVVDAQSANPNIVHAEQVSLPGNHAQICKLTARDEAPYKWLCRQLDAIATPPSTLAATQASLQATLGQRVLVAAARRAGQNPHLENQLRDLVLWLRKQGVDARWEGDVDETPSFDWHHWTQQQVQRAAAVLVVASPHHQQCYPQWPKAQAGEPGFAGACLTAEMVQSAGGVGGGRIITVTLDGDSAHQLPQELWMWHADIEYPSRKNRVLQALAGVAVLQAAPQV